MKNLYFILLAAALFMACNSGGKKSLITKDWVYYEISVNGKTMGAEELGSPTISFKEDGTYKLSFGPMSDSGKWELKTDTTFYTSSEITQSSQDLLILKLTKDTFRMKNAKGENDLKLTLVPAPKEN